MGGRLSRRRVIRRSTILKDEDVGAVTKALRRHLGEPVVTAVDRLGLRLDDSVRLAPLRYRFQDQREKMGLSLKEVSAEVKVPQNRLRAVEKGYGFETEVLHRYATFLGLESWVRRWARANSELAERMGISRPRAPRAGSRARGESRTEASRTVHRFKVRLLDIEPPIWRLIEVPSTYTFWDLHVAIQDAMGWFDQHLHAFRLRDPGSRKVHEIGIPDEEGWGENEILPGWERKIADYFVKPGGRAEYEYDFGDSWQHEIVLEAIAPMEKGKRYPQCLAGERACPPEDCGGIPGYEDMLGVIQNRSHPEYRDVMAWLGKNYDPSRFDPKAVRFTDPKKRWKAAFT